MTPTRGLVAAVSAFAVALLLLGQSCDSSRVCNADRSFDLFDQENLRAELEEEAEAEAEADAEAEAEAEAEADAEAEAQEEKPSNTYKQRFPDCGGPPIDDTDRHGGIVRQFAPFIRVGMCNHLPCGGVILSPRHILTYANCTRDTMHTLIACEEIHEVYLNYQEIEKSEVVGVSKICASRPWDRESDSWYAHDLAVFRLDRNIRFSKQVHSVCLPSAELAEGERADVLDFDYWPPTRRLLPVERGSCKHNPGEPKSSLDSRKLCLHPRNDSQKISPHDQLQGSPVIALQDGKPTVFGIVTLRIPYPNIWLPEYARTSNRRERSADAKVWDVYDNVYKLRAELNELIDRCSSSGPEVVREADSSGQLAKDVRSDLI